MRGILQGQGGKRYKTNQITGLTATVGWATANTVKLTWTNPTDVNFKGLVIRYKAGSYPTGPTDGYSFYDSNDAAPVATYTVTGANIVDGTTFYFRAFAYSYIGATRVYNTSTTGAQASGTPYRAQGIQTFTASGTFTVPYGVNSIDVFLVGGGGGGSGGAPTAGQYALGGGGGGGGKTTTAKAVSVTPGQTIPIAVGSGGNGASNGAIGLAGGASQVLTYTAAGGSANTYFDSGNHGGSGGGGGCQLNVPGTAYNAGGGGSDGSNGAAGYKAGGNGQATTTKAFSEAANTLYAGGGGGGGVQSSNANYGAGGAGGGGAGGLSYPSIVSAVAGTANTGGGGGGGSSGINSSYPIGPGASGGSGIVIIRWGY